MKIIAKCLRTGDLFSILMLDIDDFKSINDTYGHQAGNEVLKAIARSLSENCREYDTIARYGGEEFAIILHSTKIENAVSLSERIRGAVSSLVTTPLTKTITISIGIATFPAHADTADDLIKKADLALYHSKKNGKNRSSVYESTSDIMHS
jgi:diguanylate cyclase (GGDEF)-like protein